MWFDSHCHLHICERDARADSLVDAARVAGVTRMVTIAIDLESSRRSLELTELEGVSAAVGIHPGSSEGWDDAWIEEVESLARADEVVAIGETGLDFYRDYSPRADQERAFSAHIDLAKRVDKTLIIHTRESLDAALEQLAKEGPPDRLVFHCWSGVPDDVPRALGLGAYISFAGNVSFKSAARLRAAAALVPIDRLLIETDSPYLTPVPYRGTPNSPANVVHVGVAVADCTGHTPEEIATATYENAARLFSIA